MWKSGTGRRVARTKAEGDPETTNRMSNIAKRITRIGYWLVLAFTVANGAITFLNLRTIVESDRRVDRTREVVHELERLLSTLKDAETGQRGFLLTGEDEYLKPYHDARAEIAASLDRVAAITADNPSQQTRLAELRPLIADKMEELRQTVTLREEKGLDAALAVVRTDRGRWVMSQVRRVVVAMAGHEDRLLSERKAWSHTATRRAIASFVVSTSTVVFLLAVVSWLQRRGERKSAHAGALIRSSEAWLSTTLASIGDAVIATDGLGRIRLINPVARALTGWGDEAVGRPLQDVFRIINETTRLPVEQPVEEVLREGTVVLLANHTLLIARDGTEVPIEDSAAPIKDQAGRTIGVVLIFRDVTARHRALRDVQESQARKAAIVENALDAIITIDHEGKVVEFNPAAERTFGYDRAGVLGREMADLIIPAPYREAHRRGLAHYLATGEGPILGKRIEVQAQRADGGEFPVELAITPIQTGGLPLFTAHVRDITGRVRADRRRNVRLGVTQVLAESRSLLDAAPRLLQAVCEGKKWDAGEFWLIDRVENLLRCEAVWPPPGAPHANFLANSLTTTFAEGEGFPGRVWASTRPLWVPEFASDPSYPRSGLARDEGLRGAFGCPIPVGDESFGVLVFYSRDVRQPDDDLLELLSSTGGQVGQFIERTRAEDALREADRRKDEFLATLAHELRNPLAPIRNALRLMKTSPGEDAGPAAAEVEMMERQVRHLSRLVDDLMDVSRINVGKIGLRKGRVDLGSIVRTTVEANRAAVAERGHDLTVSLPTEPLELEADPTRLEQIVSNLLLNAVKYTDPGGKISLEAGREEGQVVLRVRDTGIGIEADMLGKVFDLFVQAERRLDQSQGGLGIGLSLVKTLVDLHGGSVSARSGGPGAGSEFIVRLPGPDPSRVDGGPAPRPAAVGAECLPRRQRILVVDDNLDAANSLAKLLRRLYGQDVRVAHDGLAALDEARSFHPEVILLDLGMPGMDGYEVATRLRSQPEFERIFLVALTGWGKDSDRRRSKEAGFDRHIVKPVDPETLGGLLSGAAHLS